MTDDLLSQPLPITEMEAREAKLARAAEMRSPVMAAAFAVERRSEAELGQRLRMRVGRVLVVVGVVVGPVALLGAGLLLSVHRERGGQLGWIAAALMIAVVRA